jgi:hypothetical protein
MRLQSFCESVTKTEVDRSCNCWKLQPVLIWNRRFILEVRDPTRVKIAFNTQMVTISRLFNLLTKLS